MQQTSQSLFKSQASELAKPTSTISVGMLERSLLGAFPKEDACSWDYTGMFVGDPLEEVSGVVIALDPTLSALKQAGECGANVLITHHPVFLDPPTSFLPPSVKGQTPGSLINVALANHISCMAFHTACDVSAAGLAILPALLRLETMRPLEPLEQNPKKGFGMICSVNETSLTLARLAARCVSVFKAHPRVWGNADARIEKVVTLGGSAGSMGELCLKEGIDCLICGEIKYHEALQLKESGLCIIELGHDVSELPLCALLMQEAIKAGVDEEHVRVIHQYKNWYTPETIRQ